ncbi:MAG: 2-amino-4-hydroxy-6-hydroxymethyldihydropteridine diphosphokinase [Woeseiaceae bacterium]
MSGIAWHSAFVGIGSNLNSPGRQVETAFDLIDAIPDTEVTARSSLYRSAPLGGIEQPDFVNAVASVLTLLEPRALLDRLKAIERARGREPGGARWGPRVLDLDILVYADCRIDEERLVIPHQGIPERNFVLLPLRELVPDLVIPGLGRVCDISVNEKEPRITRIA